MHHYRHGPNIPLLLTHEKDQEILTLHLGLATVTQYGHVTRHQLRVTASGLKVKFILTASRSVVNHSSASWRPPPNEASRITSSAKTRDNFEVRSVSRARLSLPRRLTVWQNQFEADLKLGMGIV